MTKTHELFECPSYYGLGKHKSHLWLGSWTGITWFCPGDPRKKEDHEDQSRTHGKVSRT